ncbi:hypothetical protein AURDEDRAFT_167328 [Auricularia subglabra TFB-10046 SS5]|nr:hypothetical protein AURDEDRAFT_167328 [Auricularia subglabra TFB-10046 SS5]
MHGPLTASLYPTLLRNLGGGIENTDVRNVKSFIQSIVDGDPRIWLSPVDLRRRYRTQREFFITVADPAPWMSVAARMACIGRLAIIAERPIRAKRPKTLLLGLLLPDAPLPTALGFDAIFI